MNNEIKGIMSKYFLFIFFAVVAFIPSNLYATHIVGGDMSFECLGNDFYEITLLVRRDCINGAEDAPFDDPASVGIFDATGRKIDWLGRLGQLYMPFTGDVVVNNNVPDCALPGSDPVCVHESVYKGTIYLPFREQGYVLAYQRCCRNGSLNNIINPLEVGASRFVCLTPETLNSCNSSPTFNEFPDVIICANETVSFDASATDLDGDSLAYKLYQSHTGASFDYPKPQPPWNPPYENLVEYASGFGIENMLGSGTALSIDVNTGLLTAEPTVTGQFLAGILVEEWRNGKKLSETRRDFEYNVRVCEVYPVADFDVEDNTCDGLTVGVTNTSTGAATFSWNFNHPSEDAQFLSTEQNPAAFAYSAPGFYTIRLEVMDADGRCTVETSKIVNVFDSQLTSSFESSNGCCIDGKTELTLTATSEEPDENFDIKSYRWMITLNDQVPFNLGGDQVSFEVGCTDEISVRLITTSENECSAEVSQSVPLVFGSPIKLDETVEICPGETATLAGFGECLVFDWGVNNDVIIVGENGFEVTPNETTVYNVTVTNGVVSEEGSVTVIVNPLPEIEFVKNPLQICENQGIVNVSNPNELYTYEWSPLEGLDFTNGQGNPIFNPTKDTEYFVTVTSDKGCKTVASVIVTVVPFDEAAVRDQIIVTHTVRYEEGTYDITLTDNLHDIHPPHFSNVVYAVQVGEEIFIFENEPVELVDVTPPLDCVISYTLTATTDMGCVVTKQDSFLVKPPCEVGDLERVVCFGGSATIGPLNPDCEYSWSPSDANLIDLSDPLNPKFTPTTTREYIVKVTDSLGTVTTGRVNVRVIQQFNVAIQPEEGLKCQTQGSFTAVADRTDLTYEWANTADFADILSTSNPATLDLNPGVNTVYVRATSPEGCQEIAVETIEMFTNIVNIITQDYNACTQATTTVTIESAVGSQQITVNWTASENIVSNNLNSRSIEVAAVGDEDVITLEYTSTNSAGCEASGTVEVPVMRSITATITGETMSCDGVFRLLGSSNGLNATFEWSLSPNFVEIIGNTAEFEFTSDTDATIYLRAKSGENCQSEIVSQELLVRTFVVLFGDLPDEICVGDMLTIQGQSSDPTTSINYGPSNNIIDVVDNTSVVITALEGQTEVNIPYSAVNDVGCTVTGNLSFRVGTNDSPIVTFEIDCTTGTVSFKSNLEDGTAFWDFGNPGSTSDVSDLGNPSYTYPAAGIYPVVLTSNKQTCNFAPPVSFNVNIPELFTFSTTDDTDVKYCNDDAVNLSVQASSNVSITWVDGAGNELASGNQLNFNPNGEVTMVFAIGVSDNPDCGVDTIPYTLEQYKFDLTQGEIPAIICSGDPFDLSVTDNTGADLTYKWLPESAVISGGNTPNPTLSLADDGDVVVQITNAEFNCITELVYPIDIQVVDLTVGADPDPDIFLCEEVVIFAESGPGVTFSWSNGVNGATQSVAPLETTTYTVTATDANGCSEEGSVTITVTVPPCDESGIFIPNAFSPNGDGSNDLLLVRSNAVKEMDFFIVNRWGDEVFRTNNQRVGWNGKFRNDGDELAPDVYAWCLVGRCSNDEQIHLVGNVSLLR